MNLSEMKQLLGDRGIRLTKSLGQNFLHDGNQLKRIVAAAELSCSDKVLEIGPGLGPLTERLAAKAGEVLAIEKDARLVQALAEGLNETPHPDPLPSRSGGMSARRVGRGARELSHEPPFKSSSSSIPIHAGKALTNVTLVHDDALEFLKREKRDWREWKLVANLPYSVASPILVELALNDHPPERMVVTLQSEVGRRLIAKPGQQDYGLLTLLVQLSYKPHQFFKIPAGCFYPEPEVDSACVSLTRRAEPLLDSEDKSVFVRLVKRGFSQRRKMMLKLLKEEWAAEWLSVAFTRLNIPTQTRAESVSLEQFVALAKELKRG